MLSGNGWTSLWTARSGCFPPWPRVRSARRRHPGPTAHREDSRVTVISTVHGPVQVGSTLTWSRRYGEAELRDYDALVERQPDGTGLLPDLLVIAPLTKLGGDLNYL